MSTSAPTRQGPARWWGDLGVRVKVLTAVTVAALVAVSIGVLGLASAETAADRTTRLHKQNVMGVSAATATQALGQTRVAVDELSRMAADLRTTVGRFTY